jgi:hypothetical protein
LSERTTDGHEQEAGPDFLVRLRPLDGRPTRCSLGMFLKVLGRYYGLQCRDLMGVPREDDTRERNGKEDRS